MTFERKADYVVEQAKAIAPNVKTWADFAAAVFGQKDGLIAKTFVDEAERGEPFIIAKAGKPKVKVMRIDSDDAKPVQRVGFLKGKIKVPDDFETMFAGEIEKMFNGES